MTAPPSTPVTPVRTRVERIMRACNPAVRGELWFAVRDCVQIEVEDAVRDAESARDAQAKVAQVVAVNEALEKAAQGLEKEAQQQDQRWEECRCSGMTGGMTHADICGSTYTYAAKMVRSLKEPLPGGGQELKPAKSDTDASGEPTP